MRLSLGCEIGYDVFADSTLIFNIEAMRGGRQRIVSERLTIDPDLPAELTEPLSKEERTELIQFLQSVVK